MSVDIVSRVRIGDTTALTDFTDRVAGYSIRQPVALQRVSQHTANITLYNNDGALTPDAGGTYSSVDWFAQCVDIDISTNGGGTWNDMFSGIVVGFELQDNGVNSTVQLALRDWVSVLGRGTDDTTFATPDELGERIKDVLASLVTNAVLPKFGGTISSAVTATSSTSQVVADIDGYIGRSLNNGLMASNLCAAWSIGIDVNTGTNNTQYKATVIGDHLATSTTTIDFVAGSPASGEIPVSSVDVGYALELLANRASITRVGGTEQTASDATSIAKYGDRTVSASQAQNVDDADALAAAGNIVNRQAYTSFTPRALSFSSALVNGLPNATGNNLKILLNAGSCGFLPCTVTYTPTGAASSTTHTCVTAGREIRAIPGRFDVTVFLLPAADYSSLVLDSSTLGVLDTNRLG